MKRSLPTDSSIIPRHDRLKEFHTKLKDIHDQYADIMDLSEDSYDVMPNLRLVITSTTLELHAELDALHIYRLKSIPLVEVKKRYVKKKGRSSRGFRVIKDNLFGIELIVKFRDGTNIEDRQYQFCFAANDTSVLSTGSYFTFGGNTGGPFSWTDPDTATTIKFEKNGVASELYLSAPTKNLRDQPLSYLISTSHKLCQLAPGYEALYDALESYPRVK